MNFCWFALIWDPRTNLAWLLNVCRCANKCRPLLFEITHYLSLFNATIMNQVRQSLANMSDTCTFRLASASASVLLITICNITVTNVSSRMTRLSSIASIWQMLSRMSNFWPPAYVHTWHEGLEKTRRQNYAFLLDTPMAEYLAGRKPCDLYTTDAFLRRRTYAFALRRGDRLKERINAELFRLREAEEMDLLYMKWWWNECSGGRKASGRQSRDRTTAPNPWRFATAASAAVENAGTVVNAGRNSVSVLSVVVVMAWMVVSWVRYRRWWWCYANDASSLVANQGRRCRECRCLAWYRRWWWCYALR